MNQWVEVSIAITVTSHVSMNNYQKGTSKLLLITLGCVFLFLAIGNSMSSKLSLQISLMIQYSVYLVV